jgi:hypothetical protein
MALQSTMSDLTQLLEAVSQGDASSSKKLLPLVYSELRRIAAAKKAHEPAGHTLQPTALVHEAWLRHAMRQWRARLRCSSSRKSFNGKVFTTSSLVSQPLPAPRRIHFPRRCIQ